MKTTQLICIQTFHAHWAGHSGYHQFLSRLPEDLRVTHIRIPRGVVRSEQLKGTEKLWFRPLMRCAKNKINPWTTENDLLAEFRLVRQVRDAIKEDGKVIIHFLDGEIGFNLFGTLRKFLGQGGAHVKLIASYHQPGPLLKTVLPYPKRTLGLDLAMTVGRSQFPFFDFLPPERLRFVPHGIDTEYFRPKEIRKKDDHIFCLTVGHWLRDFDALEKTVRTAPEKLTFRIVAGKEHVERFRDLDNVELFSGVSDEELLRLYQRSDIGLMPLEDSTANNALLEMMACGLPIVATRVGSVADYMTEEAGVLIGNNAPLTILDAVTKIANSKDDRFRMGEAARKRAIELDWSSISKDMEEIYRRI